jgi:hypothetical protein
MTNIHITEIADAIATLDIPGVHIRRLDQMPEAVDTRELPLLGPSANNPSFLTDWENVRITTAGNRKITYTLNYTLFQAPVGADRGLFKQYPAMVATAETVADAFNRITVVRGTQHIELAAMPAFGPVFDASGQQFHGATISLRVTEF